MAYHIDRATGDLVFDGWEKGIAPSPTQGIANMQSVNISTEMGEVMANYVRTQQSQPNSVTGTLTQVSTSVLAVSGNVKLLGGTWITVSSSTISGLSSGNYYVLSATLETNNPNITLAQFYNGSLITGLGAGTATFTLVVSMAKPIAKDFEKYADTNGVVQYRYFILDASGLLWVYDTATATTGFKWFVPDTSITYYGSSTPTGMAVLNGWIHVFSGNTIYCKPTCTLANTTSTTTTWTSFASGLMTSYLGSMNPHFAFVGHQGKLFYTDGSFIGVIFPNTNALSGLANIQSYASYTSSTTTGTISAVIGGSLPTLGGTSTLRIPAAFFAASGGSIASALTTGTVYWIQYALGTGGTLGSFQVFLAQSGGSALNITTGASGTQFFNTYYPVSASGKQTISFSPEALNLPFFETSTAIAEQGNTLIIGGLGNTLYPWNQVDTTPSSIINLPENNTVNMITVNNMVYIFAGFKGNIYITNGSTVSPVIKIPDYCAGIAGTPATYFEPYFIWGDAMYLRGRIYFSVQDQTSSKTGNCGGIWSFVPQQNIYIQQDQGSGMRLENQNSYGNYNGACSVLLPSQNQKAISPQFWSAWYSNVSNPSYAIDFTGTTTGTQAVIETDLVPTGTMLQKKTFQQIEYKVSAPLTAGESVSISYRQNSTDSWVSVGTVISDNTLSGYVPVSFQTGQWLQLQITLNVATSSSGSSNRLVHMRVR